MKIVILLIMLSHTLIYANEGLHFKPLLANPIEPRVGSMFQFDDDKLRLDIGTSIELAPLKKSEDLNMFLAVDVMTYTRLRDQGRFKFPVETTDYFFGLNISGDANFILDSLQYRVRLAHISAHVIDGYAKDSILSITPFVYSREFVELVFAKNIENLRIYVGANIIFSTIPKDVHKIIPQIGFEYEWKLRPRFSIIGGYDFKLVGFDEKKYGQNSIQFGILHKTYNASGIFFGYYRYDGKSIHGMFFRDYDNYNALGLQFFF